MTELIEVATALKRSAKRADAIADLLFAIDNDADLAPNVTEFALRFARAYLKGQL